MDKSLFLVGAIFTSLGICMVFFSEFKKELFNFSRISPAGHWRLGKFQGVLAIILGVFIIYLSIH
jgi:hypothetical protein